MARLDQVLESFYETAAPLGVAFVGPAGPTLVLGRPVSYLLARLEACSGFAQWHMDAWDASVFISSFGRGRFLIVQFPFAEDDRPRWGPWLAFVRLAVAVQMFLENPESGDPPASGVAVRRPSGPRPRALGAEVPLGD